MTTTTTTRLVTIGRARIVHIATAGTLCGAEGRGMGSYFSPAYGAKEATCKRCLKTQAIS